MTRNIAFVFHQLGGVGAGGVDRVVSLLANEFVDRGWQVDLLVLTSNTLIERELSHKIRVRFLAPSRSGSRLVQNAQRLVRSASLVRSYAKEHPDAVIVSFIHWINVFTILGLIGVKHGPVILSERTDPASDPKRRIARRIRDAAYPRASALVFQTDDVREYFSKITKPITAVIPNPITPDLPKWRQPESGHIEVVTASRLEAEKNLPLLIHAFAPIAREYPDARLRIYGKGRLHDDLQNEIAHAGLTDAVKLEGHAVDVHDRISTGSVFVLSSDFEGIPNALLEAMGMGMPVISTDCPVGGPRMLIEDGVSGLLVPVGDLGAMSTALQRLVSNEAEARLMGANAARARETFSTQRIATAWEDLIHRLDGDTHA